MARTCKITLAVVMVISLAGCSTLHKDWRTTQERDTIYSYKKFIKDHPGSEFSLQAQSRISELRRKQEEKSKRIAEILRNKKIGRVVIDVNQGSCPINTQPFDPSGKESQIIAKLEQMGLWSSQSGALTMRIYVSVVYVAAIGGYVSGGYAEMPFVPIPSISVRLVEEGTSYRLNDSQDPLAMRLMVETERAIKSK